MKQSDAAYQTVLKEYLQLKSRIESLTKEFEAYRMTADQERAAQETRFVQLEVLLDQKRQAMEVATKVNREQAALLVQYKEEMGDAASRRQEMIETTQQMRWVMGLHKARNSNDSSDDDSGR